MSECVVVEKVIRKLRERRVGKKVVKLKGRKAGERWSQERRKTGEQRQGFL